MKKSLLSLFTILLSFQMFAQISIRVGQHEAVTNRSGWSVPVSNFATVQEGQSIIQDILDAMGLKANFEIRTANIQNAAAVVSNGKRYVLYNPNFINSIVRTSGNRWSAISVLAHEVGHHLNGHTITSQGSQPEIELEADEFSGYVLRKMGASLDDAQSAMKLIASQQATSTHPGKQNRLSAIEKGWNTADQQLSGKNDVAIINKEPTRPVQTPRENEEPQPTGQTPGSQSSGTILETLINILGQVLFKTDQYGGNYVIDRNNVLKQVNNKWYEVGKLVKLNNAKYPYMVYDKSNTQVYVDRLGNMLNKNGQKIGLLRSVRG